MRIVEVIPLARGLRGHDTLSYYTSLNVTPGDMVRVPLRRRNVPAVVTRVAPLVQEKTRIRKASFRLKRLTAKTANPWLSLDFMTALAEEARWTVEPLGALLRASVAQALIDAASSLKSNLSAPPARLTNTSSSSQANLLILQEITINRLHEYHTLVRESFARKESAIILCPTIEEAERVFSFLEKGIAPYVILLHSGLTSRALRGAVRNALTQEHPIALVVTPTFLPIPRGDVKTIIIERESSPAYLTPGRPHMQFSRFAERYGTIAGWRVVRGDLPISAATYHRWEQGEAQAAYSVTSRVFFPVPLTLVSLRHSAREHLLPQTRQERERRAIISPELDNALRETLDRGGRAILFAARRGHAPLTVCDDCGASVVCDSCGAAMATHRQGTSAYFLCHACGAMRPAVEACAACGSWRLTSLGIATSRVAHILQETLPEVPVYVIDSDHTPNRRAAHKAIADFYAASPAVLVGTQKMLPLAQSPVDLTAVVSFDTLLSLPSWNVEERALAIGFALREITKRVAIVQTRMPTDIPLFRALSEGHLRAWYRATLALRERLGYPPFSVLVRLAVHGTRASLAREAAEIEARLPTVYFSGKSRVFLQKGNRYHQFLYLRVPAHNWPNEELAHILSELPPSVDIEVDPPSIIT
ncbi:hypothetical protein D6792_00350 [Candidatus Parcubacteria bacterium]|nr:MAG: hypothetical protein D6792_00350 [Candidatus Parcubacteria bacterium]